MTRYLLPLFAFVILAAGATAQKPGSGRDVGPYMDRFVDHAAERMKLDAPSKERLKQVLRENGEKRRVLMREAGAARRGLIEAVKDSTTADAEFRRLNEQLGTIRTRELALWQEENTALRRVLNERQLAEFTVLRARLMERAMEARPGRGGPPRGGPPKP